MEYRVIPLSILDVKGVLGKGCVLWEFTLKCSSSPCFLSSCQSAPCFCTKREWKRMRVGCKVTAVRDGKDLQGYLSNVSVNETLLPIRQS